MVFIGSLRVHNKNWFLLLWLQLSQLFFGLVRRGLQLSHWGRIDHLLGRLCLLLIWQGVNALVVGHSLGVLLAVILACCSVTALFRHLLASHWRRFLVKSRIAIGGWLSGGSFFRRLWSLLWLVHGALCLVHLFLFFCANSLLGLVYLWGIVVTVTFIVFVLVVNQLELIPFLASCLLSSCHFICLATLGRLTSVMFAMNILIQLELLFLPVLSPIHFASPTAREHRGFHAHFLRLVWNDCFLEDLCRCTLRVAQILLRFILDRCLIVLLRLLCHCIVLQWLHQKHLLGLSFLLSPPS